MGVDRDERKEQQIFFNLLNFFLQHMKLSSIIFYVYMNIELIKILLVHFYIVNEFTTTTYVDITEDVNLN